MRYVFDYNVEIYTKNTLGHRIIILVLVYSKYVSIFMYVDRLSAL